MIPQLPDPLPINVTELERLRFALNDGWRETQVAFQTDKDRYQHHIKIVSDRLRLAGSNLDLARIDRAKKVLYTMGSFACAGEDRFGAVDLAKRDVIEGGGWLWKGIRGTKDYDRWHGQGVDCEYGMCPRHGSIIFEIGIPRDRRAQEHKLTPEEIEDALYLLLNIEAVTAPVTKEAT